MWCNAHAAEESNLLQTGLNGSVWLAGEGVLASLGQETVGKVQSQPGSVKYLETNFGKDTLFLTR